MSDDLEVDRRRTFDESASFYHDARPSYPDEIFERLTALLPTNPQILEVGPGTGQATEPLLMRGARIRAIEIGPKLAVELAQRLNDYVMSTQLEIVVADYEKMEPDASAFDALVCATAYHWISAAEQLRRPPRWLVPTGRLAIIDTMQVESSVDTGYFAAAQPIYERYGEASNSPLNDPATVVPPMHDRMVRHPACVDITIDRVRWDQTYDAASYRALLNTYSGTLAMAEPMRTEMVDELVELVDESGGQVTRPLVITLATCRFAAND